MKMVSTNKIKYCLLLCSWWAYGVSGKPVDVNSFAFPESRSPHHAQSIQAVEKQGGRIFPSMFGGLLDSIPFLPLNVNIPDVFTGMFSLVNQYFDASSKPKVFSTSRTNNIKKKKKSTTTTTTPEPEEEEEEEPEEAKQNDYGVDEDEEYKKMSQADFAHFYHEYIRKKDEWDFDKKKKKKGKHKEDDFLHKIASHLAYLELEC